jgi:hypothetical protein
MAKIKNANYLNTTGFLVSVEKLPEVSFFCNGVELPGVSTTNAELPNPFGHIHQPGDMIDHGQLSLTFTVDEDLMNWLSVYEWFVGITFPETHSQYQALISGPGRSPGKFDNIYSDISIIVLSSHKNPVAEFVFANCIPSSVSGIQLNALDSDVGPAQATVTFDYSHFRVIKSGDGITG